MAQKKLVTGATGATGGYAVERLLERGHAVRNGLFKEHCRAVAVELQEGVFAGTNSLAARNVEEFRNPDGRYIVTVDGVIDGNLIPIAMLVTEDAANKVESLRGFARPWPIVKLFREYMERNLRPDPVPDAIWALPATASSK